MDFKPESLATLREKDASALRAAYGVIKEQYETVLDERGVADKKFERMRQTNHDLRAELDAADQKAASVSSPVPSLELEQAKSKIADLNAALKDEVAKSKSTQSDLEATRLVLKDAEHSLQESLDALRDIALERSAAISQNDRAKVFRDSVARSLKEYDCSNALDEFDGSESIARLRIRSLSGGRDSFGPRSSRHSSQPMSGDEEAPVGGSEHESRKADSLGGLKIESEQGSSPMVVQPSSKPMFRLDQAKEESTRSSSLPNPFVKGFKLEMEATKPPQPTKPKEEPSAASPSDRKPLRRISDSFGKREEPAEGKSAAEGPDPALVAELETPAPKSDVKSEAVVPKEAESSPQPTQAPAPTPTPKGAYLAQPRIRVPKHAVADLVSSWGPTPRQWMTIEQQEDFEEELTELEASKDAKKPSGATDSREQPADTRVPASGTSNLPAATTPASPVEESTPKAEAPPDPKPGKSYLQAAAATAAPVDESKPKGETPTAKVKLPYRQKKKGSYQSHLKGHVS